MPETRPFCPAPPGSATSQRVALRPSNRKLAIRGRSAWCSRRPSSTASRRLSIISTSTCRTRSARWPAGDSRQLLWRDGDSRERMRNSARRTSQCDAGQIYGAGYVSAPNVNTGFLHTKGMDFEANYNLSLDDRSDDRGARRPAIRLRRHLAPEFESSPYRAERRIAARASTVRLAAPARRPVLCPGGAIACA